MAAETAATRVKTRRVKDHILDQYLLLADKVKENGRQILTEKEDKEYWELTMKFAPNCVPRSQEITGEEGQAISITFDSAFKGNTGENPQPKTEL